jgi:hypothetical protein
MFRIDKLQFPVANTLAYLWRAWEGKKHSQCHKTFFSSLLILRVDKLGVSVTNTLAFLLKAMKKRVSVKKNFFMYAPHR